MTAKSAFECPVCNKESVVVGRNRADADRLARWILSHGGLCVACEAKRRAEKSAESAARNKDAGLPSLHGSAPQILWAERIREVMLDDLRALRPVVEIAVTTMARGADACDSACQSISTMVLDMGVRARNLYQHWAVELSNEITAIERYDAFVSIVASIDRAPWFIDCRDTNPAALARALRDRIDALIMSSTADTSADPCVAAAIYAESIIRPPDCDVVCKTAVDIRLIAETTIEVRLPEKREDFRVLIKNMGFAWSSGRWLKVLDFRSALPLDRLAEVGHRLVAAGFVVCINDTDARLKAVTGDFEHEQTRWVSVSTDGDYKGWCMITWRKPDDLYGVARSLPGARYKNGAVFVPPGAVLAVEEFAEGYCFSMSPGAQSMIYAYRAELAAGAVVTKINDRPAAVRDDVSSAPRALAVPLNIDIDDSLRDE